MTKNMFRSLTLFLCLSAMIACAQSSQSGASTAKLDTEEQKTLYALGLLLGRNVKTLSLTPQELELVKAGLNDAATGAKPQVEIETYGPKVNELAQQRAAASAEGIKKKGQEFADNVAKEKGATKTESGIVI